MKLIYIPLLLIGLNALAQEVIPLYPGLAPGSTETNYPEKQYFSKVWNTDVVTNVTKPTLTVYQPNTVRPKGEGVVICPGGGFMALSIQSEGIQLAKWLNDRGIAAFVLKYRLAHSGEDATQEFMQLFQDPKKFEALVAPVIPLSIDDGLAAVAYVKRHYVQLGVDPNKVGIIGFSAGGTVTAGVGYKYQPEGKPAFVAPIYAAASFLKGLTVPADAPPMFLAAATDDQLGLTADSLTLYTAWTAAHKSAELHIYAKGGHGFGMRKQNLPTDDWTDNFEKWLQFEGWLGK